MTAALGMKVRTVMIQSQKMQRRTYFLEQEREQEMKRPKRQEAPKDPGSNIIDHHERLLYLHDIPCTQPAVYLLSAKLDPDPEVYADREDECIHHHQPTTCPLLAPTGWPSWRGIPLWVGPSQGFFLKRVFPYLIEGLGFGWVSLSSDVGTKDLCQQKETRNWTMIR